MTVRRIITAVLFAGAVSLTAQQPPERERGFKPEMAYQFSGLDTVGLFNGNLNLSVPLGGEYPVGAGLSYTFVLHYSGNVWEILERDPKSQIGDEGSGTIFYKFHNGDKIAPGWRLSFGELEPPVSNAPADAGTARSMWYYRSPDASEHYFFDTLHEPRCSVSVTTDCDHAVSGFRYTRDGTYLRMEEYGEARIIEFGDGRRQRYTFDSTSNEWRLRYIYTVHSALNASRVPTTNFVKFEYIPTVYGSTATWEDWKVTDSHGRTHYVRFQSANGAIDKVEVAAFQRKKPDAPADDPADVRATYNLTYNATDQATDGTAVEFHKACGQTDDVLSKFVRPNMLTRIDLPEGETWLFEYSMPLTTCTDDSAAMTGLTLPTGGKITWSYQQYMIAQDGMTKVMGVAVRSVLDSAGNAIQKTRYTVGPESTTVDQCSSPAATTCTPEVQTVHYFDRAWGPDSGLPIRPSNRTGSVPNPDSTSGGRLTSETFACPGGACAALPERASYLKYEKDAIVVVAQNENGCSVDWPCARDRNRRVVSDTTVYVSDENRRAGTTRSAFDGLGHYRRETANVNGTSGNDRTTYTTYNFAARRNLQTGTDESVGTYALTFAGARATGFTMLATTDPWVLGNYTSSEVTEAGTTFKTQACFDRATGFLTRKRALAGSVPAKADLLALYTADSDSGYVSKEEFFGGDPDPDGDGTGLATGADICAIAVPTHDGRTFAIRHAYSAGALATSHYLDDAGNDLSFPSADNTIDSNTGLVRSSRDTAGLATTYDYDRQSRLLSVTPPGLSKTTYSYTRAIGTTPALVTVTTGSGSTGTAGKFEFDSVGRVFRERRQMPDATWSARETAYDPLGRRKSMSEFDTYVPDAAFNPKKTTWSGFDAFGRPDTVTAPDGKTTTFAYDGNRLTKRTQMIATSETAETAVTTAEEYDRLGRLISVTEDAGENGQNKVTAYTYDGASRLARVEMQDGTTVQPRTFTYDGRGLLTQEEHPESGVTKYQYDARGHVTFRDDPVADVTTTYDDAERVLSVAEGAETLQSFSYDDGGGSAPGRLGTATRYNRTEVGVYEVKEAFTWSPTKGGLLSRKDTTVTKDTNTAGQQTFSETYDYDGLGNLTTIGYPGCSGCPARTVKPTYKYGSLTAVTPYTPVAVPITYHPNGALHTVPHANAGGGSGPLYTQTIADGLARPATITVSSFCDEANLGISVQPKPATVAANQPANVTVQAYGATSYQWYRGTGASSTKLTGQESSTLTYAVTEEATFWVRVGNGTCTIDSNEVIVSVNTCTVPPATITAPAAMTASSEAEASVTESPGATYAWSITGGEILTGDSTSTVTFRAGCSGPVVLNVTVTTCTSNPGSASVGVEPFTATVSGSTTIDQGESATIEAELTGTPSWTVTWSDNAVRTAASSPHSYTVTPLRTTTYTVTTVTDPYGCAGVPIGYAAITVKPPAPGGVTATAAPSSPSAFQVTVSWTFTGLADSFDIYRGDTKIGSAASAARSYVDTTVQPGIGYAYWIRTVTGGTRSDFSARDIATAIAFTDDPLVAGVTAAKAVHLLELRSAVNAVRSAAGLPNASFTGTIAAGGGVTAVQVEELGTYLNQARSNLGLPLVSLTRHPLLGKLISAGDLTEIRGGVK